MNKNNRNRGVESAIEKAGSTRSLARRCGVSQPAVMKWLYENCPAERAVQMERLVGVAREDIRPDLFKWEKKP